MWVERVTPLLGMRPENAVVACQRRLKVIVFCRRQEEVKDHDFIWSVVIGSSSCLSVWQTVRWDLTACGLPPSSFHFVTRPHPPPPMFAIPILLMKPVFEELELRYVL